MRLLTSASLDKCYKLYSSPPTLNATPEHCVCARVAGQYIFPVRNMRIEKSRQEEVRQACGREGWDSGGSKGHELFLEELSLLVMTHILRVMKNIEHAF